MEKKFLFEVVLLLSNMSHHMYRVSFIGEFLHRFFSVIKKGILVNSGEKNGHTLYEMGTDIVVDGYKIKVLSRESLLC